MTEFVKDALHFCHENKSFQTFCSYDCCIKLLLKLIIISLFTILNISVFGQDGIKLTFKNDYEDVYHLSLIIFTPDGKGQTRVSNVDPKTVKEYSFPVGTEIYIADNKQEEFAMKGNDIRKTNVKPWLVITISDNTRIIPLTSIKQK